MRLPGVAHVQFDALVELPTDFTRACMALQSAGYWLQRVIAEPRRRELETLAAEPAS